VLKFDRIVLEVTQACPHACLHCYNYWRETRGPVRASDTLTRAGIREVVARIRRDTPIRQVALSGGEPLLREDLPGIVADLAAEGLSAVVITNGSLLSEERVSRFSRNTIFEVTLFSANAGLHDQIAGRKNAFAKVITAALAVQKHHCHLAVAVVVTRLNAHDTRRALELGISLGADGLLLNRVNLGRLSLPIADRLVPTVDQLRMALQAAENVASEYGAAISVSVPVPPCVIDPAPYPHLHFGWCPRGGADAYYTVSHNGLLRPCNHASMVLGDLRREGFAEIVTSKKTSAFWKPVPPACRKCDHPLRDLCRGGCPAASYECYGTQERWDPYIDHVGTPLQTAPSSNVD
jgi:pyrroloquinoline quinone biosynthesis protein E